MPGFVAAMLRYAYTPYLWLLLLPVIASSALAAWAWRRRNQVLHRILVAFALAIAWWSLAYIGQVTGTTYEVKRFWNDIKYLGVAVVTPAWFLFVVHYTGRVEWLQSRWLRGVLGLFLLSPLLVFTNDQHHLWYTALWMPEGGPIVELKALYGWGFFVFAALTYGLVIASLVLLLEFYQRTSPLYHGQVRLLIVSALVPLLANLAYQTTHITVLGIFNLNTLAFVVSASLVAYALWRHRLLDILPVASRLIIEQMMDAVLVLDADNRVVDINPMAERIAGRRAKEVIGRPVKEVIRVEGVDCRRFQETAEVTAEVMLGQGPDRRYFDFRLSPLRAPDGRLLGRVAVLRDIHERKKAEMALAQLRSDWTAMLVHDLRKPLGTILSALDALEVVTDMDAAERARMLSTIRQRVEGMNDLTTALLQLEQLESGALPLSRESFDVADIIQAVHSMYQAEAKANGIAFETKVPPYPIILDADMALLSRALDNLVRNAIRHTPAGGSIAIGAGISEAGDQVWIEVADTGEGIDPADLPYIFDRFTRGRKHKGVGFGLGLTFCKLVAEAHHGRIDVHSTLGQGSAFILWLPCRNDPILWSHRVAETSA